MTIPWTAGGTPYVVPSGNALQAWPVGVDWTTIPPGTNVTTLQKTAALASVCQAATSQVNGEMNFPLHSVLNTEEYTGPNYRITVRQATGVVRMILSRWPVTDIVSVQTAPAAVFPRQWTTIPAGYYQPEYPVIGRYNSNTAGGSGEGGQAILIAPGFGGNWCLGRWGYAISAQYIHGWPHTHLTAAAEAGASTLTVGDVTGWAPFTAGQPGAEGIIYDNLGGQEPIQVTAATATNASSPPVGTGTLTLASPLAYGHDPGIMVSALPSDVIWATALFAGAEALTRGAQATVVQTTPGHGAGLTGADSLRMQACSLLQRFKRTI
jgi:hypothetical protein